MGDDLRPRGTVQVACSAPDCPFEFWVGSLDPRLPDGPFLCPEHDGQDQELQCCICSSWFSGRPKEGSTGPFFCNACLQKKLPQWKPGMPFTKWDQIAYDLLVEQHRP